MAVLVTGPTSHAASPATINLGSSSSFAVLADTYITTGATSTINGDIGAGAAITTGANSVHAGSLYAGAAITTGANNVIEGNLSAVAAITTGAGTFIEGSERPGQRSRSSSYTAAMTALDSAMADASRRTATGINSALGGRTLYPGVHSAAASGFLTLAGTVTLDAQGDENAVFIIKSPSYLVTAANSSVTLANEAQAENVFWVTRSYLSLGANSSIEGNLLATGYVTLGAHTAVQGRIFSQNSYILFGTSGPGSSFGVAEIGTTATPSGGGSDDAADDSPANGALTPTFSNLTATTDGFTLNIDNYDDFDSSYEWTGVASKDGTFNITSSGEVKISGVDSATAFTATITWTKDDANSGFKSVDVISLDASSNLGELTMSSTIQSQNKLPRVEVVPGVVIDSRSLSSATPPRYNKFESYEIGCMLTDEDGEVLAGKIIDIDAPGLLINTGLVAQSARQNYTLGTAAVMTDNDGLCSVEVRSNLSGAHTISLTSGDLKATKEIVFDEALVSAGSVVTIDAPETTNKSEFDISVHLNDVFGNGVQTTTASQITVTYSGPGEASLIPEKTDIDGVIDFSIAIGQNERGIGTISATFDRDGNMATVNDKIIVSQQVQIGQSASSSQKITVGSFLGYVAIYAMGYEGQRLTAQVGNDWVIVPSIPASENDLFLWIEPTGAGVDCKVRVFIDRVLVKTVYLTTR